MITQVGEDRVGEVPRAAHTKAEADGRAANNVEADPEFKVVVIDRRHIAPGGRQIDRW